MAEINDAIARQRSVRSFKAAEAQVGRLEELIKAAGHEPPEEQGEGWLSQTLDFIDTPKQWFQGAVASGIGMEDYKDLGLLDAAALGAERDITAWDIMEEKDLLQGDDWGSKIGRGVLGFGAEVLTDPLTYATFGTGIAKRAAGAGLASGKFATKSGGLRKTTEILEDLVTKKQGPLVKEAEEKIARLGLQGDEAERLIGQAKVAGADEADYVFKVAKSIQKNKKQAARAGKSVIDDIPDPFGIQSKSEWVAKQLDLQNIADSGNLFARPGLRFVPEFGVGRPLGTLLGVDEFGNIPILTNATEELFEKVGGATYNAVRVVGKGLSKGADATKAVPVLGPTVDFARSIGGTIASFPALFSRRIAAGGADALMNLTEHEAHKAILKQRNVEEAEAYFKRITGNKEIRPEMMDAAAGAFEAQVRKKEQAILELRRRGTISPSAPRREIEEAFAKHYPNLTPEKVFETEVARLRQTFNAKEAGLGDSLANVMTQMQKDFAEWGEVEMREGILEQTLDNYIKHSYIATSKFDLADKLPRLKQTLRDGKDAIPGSSFHRQIATLEQARAMGLQPITDLKVLWAERKFQHDLAMLDKKFSERLAFQFALPAETMKKLSTLITSNSVKKAEEAQAFIKQHKLSLTVDDLLQHATDSAQAGIAREYFQGYRGAEDGITTALRRDPVWGVPRFKNGMVMTPQGYDELRRIIQNPKSADQEALAHALTEAEAMGLKFNDVERAGVEHLYNNYKSAREVVLERTGEEFIARASAAQLPNRIRTLVEKARKNGKFDDEVADFYNGVLPMNLRRAVNESYETRSWLKQITDNAEKLGVPVPAKDNMARIAKAYTTWLGGLKKGFTMFWPAYYARNVFSAQLMMTKAGRILGDALNPARAFEVHNVLTGKKGLNIAGGKTLSASEVKEAMRQYGVAVDFNALSEVSGAWADELEGMGILTKRALEAAKNGDKQAAGVLKKTWGMGEKFTTVIENYGRQHMFVSLLKQGQTPASAAQMTNKIMIDYSRGKTAFERNVVNNIIFFYAFSRGEASNTLTAMLTRPGSLTAQLHAVDGVAEMLRDPNANPLPMNVKEAAETLRSSETLSRVIGTSETGNPLVMNRSGVPIEDLTRFVNIKTPREMTFNALVNAGMESSGRTMKTFLSQVNPILRTPIELATNKNLFFDRPLTDRSIRKVARIAPALEADWGKLEGLDPRRIPAKIIETLNDTTMSLLAAKDNGDGTWTAHPSRLAAAGLFPFVGRALNTTRALSKESVPIEDRLLKALTGVKVMEVDPQKSRIYDRKKQLEDYIEYEVLPKTKRQLEQQRRLAAQLDDEDR